MSAITSSGGNSTTVGVLMAFNTIGAQFLDLVDLAIDTLAGGNVVGTSAPTETTAYIHDSSLGTVAHPIGALSVTASSTESINATVGNSTFADAPPSGSSSKSFSASAVLTENQLLTSVTAYIDEDNNAHDTVTGTGAADVSATDNASIVATSTLTALGTPAATGPANDYAGLAIKSYKYTNFSANNADTGATTVQLAFGDQVAVEQPDGSITVYEFMGTSGTVNLSTGRPTDPYSNLEYWKPLSADQLTEEAEAQSANPKLGSAQSGKPGETVQQSSSSSASTSSSTIIMSTAARRPTSRRPP